jgi:hypothetical protein
MTIVLCVETLPILKKCLISLKISVYFFKHFIKSIERNGIDKSTLTKQILMLIAVQTRIIQLDGQKDIS